MKIYGKETDFYDVALVYGQDPICAWTRKFEEYSIRNGDFTLPEDMFGSLDWYKIPPKSRVSGKLMDNFDFSCESNVKSFLYSGSSYCFNSGYVFFCGKTYPFLNVSSNFNDTNVTFYNSAALTKWVDKNTKLPEFIENIWNKRSGLTLIEKLDQFFSQKFCCDAIHRINNITVYVVTDGKIHEGGSLKHFQFAKVFEPYTCLQEIEMYLSGCLGGQSPKMIETSDITRLESHGFDKVTSFRKGKQK